MATTNAAITQTNNALKNLNTAAMAQKQAEAGNNVSQNLSKMNTNLNKSAQGLQNAAKRGSGCVLEVHWMQLPFLVGSLKLGISRKFRIPAEFCRAGNFQGSVVSHYEMPAHLFLLKV